MEQRKKEKTRGDECHGEVNTRVGSRIKSGEVGLRANLWVTSARGGRSRLFNLIYLTARPPDF
jgi:hypothetical protein